MGTMRKLLAAACAALLSLPALAGDAPHARKPASDEPSGKAQAAQKPADAKAKDVKQQAPRGAAGPKAAPGTQPEPQPKPCAPVKPCPID